MLRAKPYRLLFPLALPLSWAGVLPWFLVGLGVVQGHPAVFHSIAQVQGLMSVLAAGFLLTAIPGRTGTPHPGMGLILLCALAPVATVVLAGMDRLGASQVPWLIMVAVLIAFAWRRFHAVDARRRPPDSFVWVPIGLGMGVVGSLMIGAYGIGGEGLFALHQLGTLLLLQGMFVGLVVGVGGMVLPLLTRGVASADGSPQTRWVRVVHSVAAALLVGTFVLEVYGPVGLENRAWAYGLRGSLVLAVLLWAGRIHLLPTKPGAHRWLVWVGAWCLPLGYLLGMAIPAYWQAGLHTVFIGGFGMLGLSVALHVSWAHGGDGRVHGSPGLVGVLGVLFAVALACRALVVVDGARFGPWLAASSGAFLLATLVWAWLAFPAVFRRRAAE